MAVDKEVAEFQNQAGSVYKLFVKNGLNLYFFKPPKGKLHAVLEGDFTSRKRAEKAWTHYITNYATFHRTSKHMEETGAPEDKNCKLKKPTKEYDATEA